MDIEQRQVKVQEIPFIMISTTPLPPSTVTTTSGFPVTAPMIAEVAGGTGSVRGRISTVT